MISFSQLKHIARSPAHYREAVESPSESTPAMRRGSLVHALTLGTRPDYKWTTWQGDRRTKGWKDFKAEHEGYEIFTVAEYDTAARMADAVRTHPEARRLLESSGHEVPAKWTVNGFACETRGIDLLGADWIADLKTTVDASPYRFGRDCLRRLYHAQLAWYHDAAIALEVIPERHLIIGVESSPPHCVTVLELTPRAIEAGRAMCMAWLEQLKVCRESDTWPGYGEAIQPLDIADDTEVELIVGDEVVAA